MVEYVFVGYRIGGVLYGDNPLYMNVGSGLDVEAVYDKVESKIQIFEVMRSTVNNDYYVLGYPIRFPTLAEAVDYVVNVLVPQLQGNLLPLAIFFGSLAGIYYLKKGK